MKISAPFLLFFSCSLFGAYANSAEDENTVAFSYFPQSQWDVPFPSDIFTVPFAEMLNQRRVNLPIPQYEALISERVDVESVSVLDGFSLFPRITVPLSGAVPDVDTFTSYHVFLIALDPGELRGKVIPIDQRIVDDSVHGAPRLIFAPDEYLNEQSRYAIVVTRGLTGAGKPFNPSPAFQLLVRSYQLGIPPSGPYNTLLYDAMDALHVAGIAAPADLATLSVFTTRTVSDVTFKLMQRLITGEVPISPPQFDIGDRPGIEFFNAKHILSLDSYQHRASQPSDGSHITNFPPRTLRLQDSGPGFSGDSDADVFIENVRTGERFLVPVEFIDGTNGAITGLDVSVLAPQPDDELAVLVRKGRMNIFNRPFYWSKLGYVMFGSVEAPRYTDTSGRIPTVSTGAEFVPPQFGTESIVFAGFLPPTPSAVNGERFSSAVPDVRSSSSAPGGWSVVHLLHGGAESTSSFLSSDVLNTATVFASRGIATVAFTAAGFGGGPQSRVEVITRFGIRTIRGIGRGLDADEDGLYEMTESYDYPQRISDLATVIRSIQMGADLNDDDVPDLSQSPAHTYVAGISYGGGAAFISSAFEPNATAFVANVPRGEGSRVHTAGFQPVVSELGRSFTEGRLNARTPALVNEPSPVWGGGFNEDIPLKRRTVQVGMVPGAEAIQRALDFNMWRNLQNMPLAYTTQVKSGVLRGEPAQLLIQVARGDGASVNSIQGQMIHSGGLESKTVVVRLDNEPRFDEQWGLLMKPELARHGIMALPYLSNSQELELASRICHYTRVQIADYFKSQATLVPDPDAEETEFSGDVFQFPATMEIIEEMMANPGLRPVLPDAESALSPP